MNVRIQTPLKPPLTDADRHHTGTHSASSNLTHRVSHLGIELILKGANVKVSTYLGATLILLSTYFHASCLGIRQPGRGLLL